MQTTLTRASVCSMETKMRSITLDCMRMTSRAAMHTCLKEMLALPSNYGRNLDALYDCLTAITAPTDIILREPNVLDCGYGMLFLEVLADAARKTSFYGLGVRNANWK